MSVPHTLPSQSLRSDEAPLAEYRSISWAAVSALGLGLASALILASPLLAPVPVAGVIVSCLALRAIWRSGGQLIGEGAALAGLCLACLFLAWGLGQSFGRQSILHSRARESADAWITLVRAGKLKEALQFRKAAISRISSPEALTEHYEKSAESQKELREFEANSVVKVLSALGTQGDVRFEGFASTANDGYNDRFVLTYSCPSAGDAATRKPFWIHVTRLMDDSAKRHDWQVAAATDTPPMTP